MLATWAALALGTFAAAHFALLVGLARRRSWLRAAVALFIPPLAAYWGYGEGMRRRAFVWLCAALAYAGAVAVRG
jgi:hypothetical protein